MDPKENLRHSLDKLPSTEVDAQEEMTTPVDRDNTAEVMLQDPRSDNTKVDTENPSVSNTKQDNENQNDGNNIEDVKENPSGQTSSQDRRSDNTEEDIENLSVGNTMQHKEYINGNNNMVDKTENPRSQTNSNNIFGDNNCSSETSHTHLIVDDQLKDQLEIATGGIAQIQLNNTREKVEAELSNPGICRQRVIPSSNSNEEPQHRLNTLWRKVERLNTIVNEETNRRAGNASERSIQRNFHFPLHQVFDGIRQMCEMVLDELISEHQYFRQVLDRDRPTLEHVQINSFRESERQGRLRYYSNRATILNLRLTQCRSVNRRLTIMMNGYSDETRQIPSIQIRILQELMRELTDISEGYRIHEDDPPAFDYSSAEHAREIQLNNDSSVQELFDKMHRYRMTISEEIVRKHQHLLHLLVRDRPFLDYIQINSSREAERQLRLRYYSNRVTMLSIMVTRCRSINRMFNRVMTIFYDGTKQISLMALIILKGLKRELDRLSAENVRHEDELPALDDPDETLSVILPSYIISIFMVLVLFYASTNTSYNGHRRFYRK